MISGPLVTKRSIRWHYDLALPFYRLLWGPHIHHGLWNENESPKRAQIQLTEALAGLAGIQPSDHLLDVGCGLGGSSIFLARGLHCRTTGITLSPMQRRWAALSATLHGVGRQTSFRCADAESVDFADNTFDVVWSIECTEHLFDKPCFFARAARWLKPGGRMAICAWLAGDNGLNESQTRQVYDVCEGFFCPSLGSMADYQSWMQNAGLTIRCVEDWTPRVAQTWEICRSRVERSKLKWLVRLFDREEALFLDRFSTILSAYETGAMKYGCFVATREN